MGRCTLAGRSVPSLVTQIADGENGGVMTNEFPHKYFEVVRECSSSGTPILNVTEYLERLFASGLREEELPTLQPLLQHRVWERTTPGDVGRSSATIADGLPVPVTRPGERHSSDRTRSHCGGPRDRRPNRRHSEGRWSLRPHHDHGDVDRLGDGPAPGCFVGGQRGGRLGGRWAVDADHDPVSRCRTGHVRTAHVDERAAMQGVLPVVYPVRGPARSNEQNRRAGDSAGSQIFERIIRTAQRVLRRRHLDVMASGEFEERSCVGAGVGGNRPHLPLLEQVALIVQCRDVAEVNARDGERSPAVEALERG